MDLIEKIDRLLSEAPHTKEYWEGRYGMVNDLEKKLEHERARMKGMKDPKEIAMAKKRIAETQADIQTVKLSIAKEKENDKKEREAEKKKK